jgi:hypothetical protein
MPVDVRSSTVQDSWQPKYLMGESGMWLAEWHIEAVDNWASIAQHRTLSIGAPARHVKYVIRSY